MKRTSRRNAKEKQRKTSPLAVRRIPAEVLLPTRKTLRFGASRQRGCRGMRGPILVGGIVGGMDAAAKPHGWVYAFPPTCSEAA